MRHNTCLPWKGGDATLDQLRKRASEKREKRMAKLKSSGKKGTYMTELEINNEKEKIFSEYLKAPKDNKPTIKGLAEKYGFCVNTVNKWFRVRGIRANRRTP